jgi:hypothetical protein
MDRKSCYRKSCWRADVGCFIRAIHMPNEKKVNNGMREWVRDFVEATCINPVDGHLRKNRGALVAFTFTNSRQLPLGRNNPILGVVSVPAEFVRY